MNAQETSLSAALAVRFRPDLSVDGQWFGGRRYWIVKDPVSLRYFKFREEEYAVIRLLDGKKGLEEIRSRFEQQHAPRRITLGRLQSFLINLGRNGLLLSDAPDQAQQLLARRQLQSAARLQVCWRVSWRFDCRDSIHSLFLTGCIRRFAGALRLGFSRRACCLR